MGKKQDDPRGKQKGAQAHAEGQHGEKTHTRLLEEIHAEGRPDRSDQEQLDREKATQHPIDGGHRLFQRGREQMDPADEQSEKSRLNVDVTHHDHERRNFQVKGGTASHPAMPRAHIDPEHPDSEPDR